MPSLKLNLVRVLVRAFGAGNLQIGTCPTCHCLVDVDAVDAHSWWHEQQMVSPELHTHARPTYETRPIKIGRHML